MLQTVANFAIVALVFTVACATYRLIRGPRLPDRVVALDLLASVGIGIAAVYTLVSDDPFILDIALVVALLSFLGTVAFGYFLERNR